MSVDLAVHQAQYLHWLGYFDKMSRADVFCYLNDVQYKKNEWQNRNRIKTAQSWRWTTVPVTGYKFLDSQYLKVLIETGIIGLAAFVYLLYSIFKLRISHLKKIKTPYFKGNAIGFLAGFIGLLFHTLGTNTFIIVRIMDPFWFFAGIIVILPELERRNTAQEIEIPDQFKIRLRSHNSLAR